MFTLSCAESPKQQGQRNNGALINVGLIQLFTFLSIFNKSLLGYSALGKWEFQHPPRTWNCTGLNSGCSWEGLSQGSIVVDCRNMCALHHFSHFSQATPPHSPKPEKPTNKLSYVCTFWRFVALTFHNTVPHQINPRQTQSKLHSLIRPRPITCGLVASMVRFVLLWLDWFYSSMSG